MVFEELRHVWPNSSLPAILPVKCPVLEIRREKNLKPCFRAKYHGITFYNVIHVKRFFHYFLGFQMLNVDNLRKHAF